MSDAPMSALAGGARGIVVALRSPGHGSVYVGRLTAGTRLAGACQNSRRRGRGPKEFSAQVLSGLAGPVTSAIAELATKVATKRFPPLNQRTGSALPPVLPLRPPQSRSERLAMKGPGTVGPGVPHPG